MSNLAARPEKSETESEHPTVSIETHYITNALASLGSFSTTVSGGASCKADFVSKLTEGLRSSSTNLSPGAVPRSSVQWRNWVKLYWIMSTPSGWSVSVEDKTGKQGSSMGSMNVVSMGPQPK